MSPPSSGLRHATRGDQLPLPMAGADAATSLKEKVVARIPQVQDAAHFREARQLLRTELGGATEVKRELVFAGFVDPETNLLTTREKPMNIFARVASGASPQMRMDDEQEALGPFRDKFCICCNKPENDLRWDSSDPKWLGKASMSRRHRFLTTRDLHWLWFNALVFGMGRSPGESAAAALKEVESMREAALLYARNIGGWSDQIGLYVNVFGHNSVNSLFVHIVDLSVTGPSFEALSFKNCPIDDVLKVLSEEAMPGHVSQSLSFMDRQPTDDKVAKFRAFFFAGTDGATSLKQELTGRIPVLVDAAGYREARRLLQDELGGLDSLREELSRAGFVDRYKGELTTGLKPNNIFARLASGAMVQAGMAQEQSALKQYQERFMICRNLPECDAHWDSEDPEWVGRASMSLRHRFLTTRNLDWRWFNALSFGLLASSREDQDETNGNAALQAMNTAVAEVEAMKAAALTYTREIRGWSDNVGLFFHVFGHNSVNSLHLHIVDMEFLGPTFMKTKYKNLPLDAVLKVLKEEVATLTVASCMCEGSQNEPVIVAVSRSTGVAGLSRIRHPSGQPQDRNVSNSDLVEMNVGGELLIVGRKTLLQAPPESLLHRMFAGSWEAPPVMRDNHGRVFLDMPPVAFRRIVDHLRLLSLLSTDRELAPIENPDHDLRALAGILGLENFLFNGPKRGRFSGVETQVRGRVDSDGG